MIYTFFEVASVLFELLLVHIFFGWWFGYKNVSFQKKTICIMIYFALRSITTLLPIDPIFRVALNYFIFLAVAAVLFETTKPSAVYSAFLFMALAILAEFLGTLILSMFGFDFDLLLTLSDARVISIALSKTIRLIIVLIAASILRKNQAALSLKQVAPILPCVIVSIYICIVFFTIFPYLDERFAPVLVIALAGLLYLCGIIVFHTQSIKNTVIKIEEQKLANKYFEMQQQYYQNVIIDREETRSLWHDLQKHVVALEALVETGDTLSAKSEYEQIREAFKNVGNIVDTESAALDAILQHNIDKARARGIPVGLNVRVSPNLPIPAVDMSVIIGNTFDNAIDECLLPEITQPRIDVSVVSHNSMLFYEISNPCSDKEHKKPGNIHGYGLKNVSRCVQQHTGSMEIRKFENEYVVSIRVNCG